MNLQSLMKQAQSMQKNIIDSKSKIESETFTGKSELVSVIMNGKKELVSVKIEKSSNLQQDDIEVLEDMIVIAVNDALNKINKEIEEKLGSQAGAFSNFL